MSEYTKSSVIFCFADMSGNHIWTGANDVAKESQWLWAGQNTALNYTKWTSYPVPGKGKVQQPDNIGGYENCVHLYHILDYGWNDASCLSEYYFICEYKLW